MEFVNFLDFSIKVFLVPRKTLIIENVLKDLGVYNDIKLGEYNLELIPFDYDLLSMEISSCFKECYIDGDLSSLYYIAKCLTRIQNNFGTIPHIKAAGPLANVCENLLKT